MNDGEKPAAVSEGGSKIIRHGEEPPWRGPGGESNIEQILAHIEAHLGKTDRVFHEVASDAVHIDVHFVKPTGTSPFTRLVTSGMSDMPMATPDGYDVPKFAELTLALPGDWRLDQESFNDEAWYWPVRLIKGLARFPHKYNTWLGWGHTVPNGDPPQPYASNTKFCGIIILSSVTAPDEFHKLRIDDKKEIAFYAVIPLYAEEMDLKLRLGIDELIRRFDKAEVTDIIDPLRRNTAKGRFKLIS